MNKKLMFIFACAASCAISAEHIDYKSKTPADMLRIITGAHTRAFVVNDLIAKPIDQESIDAWNETVHHVNRYVKLNCKNRLGMKDKQIMSALNLVEKTNTDMIHYIKEAHNAINDPEELYTISLELNRIRDEAMHLFQLIQLIETESASKKDALKVLSTLARTVKVTANAALTHTQRYL